MNMGKKDTAITAIFILDKSGSMSHLREAAISGVNEYIGGLKADKEGTYTFTLTLFDSISIESPFLNMDIQWVPRLTEEVYRPLGNTPLYDAVCKTVKRVEHEVAADTPVLVTIMTDGLENDSREYTKHDLSDLVTRLTKKGWTFTFMGANMDAYAVSASFGIPAANAMNWAPSPEGTTLAMRAHASSTSRYANRVRSGESAGEPVADFYAPDPDKADSRDKSGGH